MRILPAGFAVLAIWAMFSAILFLSLGEARIAGTLGVTTVLLAFCAVLTMRDR